MSDTFWILVVRAAGALHLVTLVLAHQTPIPRGWDQNLAGLPALHRRFAVAQNFAIGGVIAFLGLASLLLARELTGGSPCARALCAGTGFWWGGRLCILPWLQIWPELRSTGLRLGFVALHLECAAFAVGYLWLALR